MVDILAFGAHPDDVELSAAGTLIKHINMGFSVGIIDLTQGEMGTRGTPEIRVFESEQAMKIIGAEFRENLKMARSYCMAAIFCTTKRDCQKSKICGLSYGEKLLGLLKLPFI